MPSIGDPGPTHSVSPDGATAKKAGRAPTITLLLLAPIIAEVLFGATRLSFIFVLIPEIMVWGCGALMIRETVRRWRGGWASMILLGLALAVAEECVIQQTSLAPLVGAQHVYGRYFGVNWVYLLALLVYECVWVVLVPVGITELVFPDRRHEPWLQKRGLVISGVVFLVGCYIAWYAWTQRARTVVYHEPPYQPPLLAIAIALGVILLLILAAFKLRTVRLTRAQAARSAPRPWILGLATFFLSLLWFLLTVVAYGGAPHLPFWIPMVGGVVWAALSLILISHWASGSDWREMHNFALVFGALLASMLAGYMILAGGALLMDWIGKAVLNVAAVVLMIGLAQRVRLREAIRS